MICLPLHLVFLPFLSRTQHITLPSPHSALQWSLRKQSADQDSLASQYSRTDRHSHRLPIYFYYRLLSSGSVQTMATQFATRRLGKVSSNHSTRQANTHRLQELQKVHHLVAPPHIPARPSSASSHVPLPRLTSSHQQRCQPSPPAIPSLEKRR